jgi:hypothetical protein
LVVTGRIDEAKKMLEYVRKEYPLDSSFSSSIKRVRGIEKRLFLAEVRIMCYLEQFEKLDAYLKANYEMVKDLDFNSISFLCNAKLGKVKNVNSSRYSYLFSQIANYSEESFLKHVKKHLADFNKDLDEPNKNIFVPDFPFTKVLEEIKKYIPSEKSLSFGYIEDTYVFKYECCGREDNRMVDYFKVVCLHNSKKIITMCPSSVCENLPYVDLSYMIEKDKKEVKRESQIEKFNRRFKR